MYFPKKNGVSDSSSPVSLNDGEGFDSHSPSRSTARAAWSPSARSDEGPPSPKASADVDDVPRKKIGKKFQSHRLMSRYRKVSLREPPPKNAAASCRPPPPQAAATASCRRVSRRLKPPPRDAAPQCCKLPPRTAAPSHRRESPLPKTAAVSREPRPR